MRTYATLGLSGLMSSLLLGSFSCADDREGANAKIPGALEEKGETENGPDANPSDNADAALPGAEDEMPGGNSENDANPDSEAQTDECDKIDFVFVIDDSGSMLLDQLGLIADFPNFIKILDAYRTRDGKPLDYRIGVTSSSIGYELTDVSESYEGDDGLFRRNKGSEQGQSCWDEDRRWMERKDSDIQERFSCAAEVGANGLGHEMQMLALSMSLRDRVKSGDHKGFLRKDALLATVLLTDEDDCSNEDRKFGDSDACNGGEWPDDLLEPSALLKRMDALKGNSRKRWALGVLSKYICVPDFQGGFLPPLKPKKRLRSLVDQAGKNAVYVTVCNDDYATHLKTVLDTFTEACQDFPPPV